VTRDTLFIDGEQHMPTNKIVKSTLLKAKIGFQQEHIVMITGTILAIEMQ
jgi:hypothetical protein